MPGAGCLHRTGAGAYVTIGRFFIPESANWLLCAATTRRQSVLSGDCCTASRAILRTLHCSGGRTRSPARVELTRPSWRCSTAAIARHDLCLGAVVHPGSGTYGIGIFTPTILAAAFGGGADHIRSLSDMISDDILAAKGAAMINVLLIVGIFCAVVLADIAAGSSCRSLASSAAQSAC